MIEWKKYLSKIYYDPSHPASYEGMKTLYNFVKKDKKYNISLTQIKKWLSEQDAYSLNKRVKRNFQRGRVIVSGIDDQWDVDLASFAKDSDENDGYKYLLVVIDIFSRYAWIEPLKDKTSKNIVTAFNKILKQGRKPRRLRSDAATDFTSRDFQNNLKKKKITHFTTHSEKQANYVERFIKTIKTKIWRYIRSTNSRRYIDVLQDLVESYNKSWHSGIKSEPINVTNINESKLWWQMYWPKLDEDINDRKDKNNYNSETTIVRRLRKHNPFTFKVGDKVRISHLRSAFQREYDIKWSGEIFKINKRFLRQNQPIYKIVDWFNKPVKGTFYQTELQKANLSREDTQKIDKIIKYSGRGKNRKALVQWLNWPKKFNSWILLSDIVKTK